MAENSPGLLGHVGNFLLQSRAFGDPAETFRRNTPAGLLDDFTDEEKRQMGEELQKRFRTLGRSRSAIRASHREGVGGLAEEKAANAQLEQYQNFVVGNPKLSRDQKILMLQHSPEEGMKLLTEGANVGPGNKRVDALGREIASQGTGDIQEYEYGLDNPGFVEHQRKGDSENLSVREQKIADWRRLNPELSERQVVGIVDGHIDVRQDPQSGRNFIVDIDGTQIPVRTVGVDKPTEPTGTSSVDPNVDVQNTTGLAGALRRGANVITDMIGMGAVADSTDRAKTELTNFSRLAQLRIAEHVTEGRRSNLLIEMLEDIMVDPASFLQGSENARNKLDALDRALEQIIESQRYVVDNPYENRATDVSKARRAIHAMNGLRQDVQIMLKGFGKDGGRKDDMPAVDPADVPEGVDPSLWQHMTPEERALWQN